MIMKFIFGEIMGELEVLIPQLNEKEREILTHIAETLIKSRKLKKLREEIEERRDEIKKGDVLSHDEFWE